MPERTAITQRADGRYVATLQVHGKRRFLYGKTEREVQKKLDVLIRDTVIVGALPAPGRRTINDLLDAWLDACRPNLKPKTVLGYENTAQWYLRPTLGHVKLNQLEPAHVQALYGRLNSKGHVRVPAQAHAVLRRACRLGVLWGWLVTNPCDRVIAPRYRAKTKDVWSANDTARFLAATSQDRHGALWLFLVYTGARIGEATALRWDDLNGNSVTIRQAAHRIRGDWAITAPKTHAGVRTMTLPDAVVGVLRQERARQAERRLRTGAEWQDDGRIFSNDRGGILHPSMTAHALRATCDRLKLARLTPHGLRHLSASLLLAQNVPLPNVSRRLGHANPGITARIYSHAVSNDDLAARAMERALTFNDAAVDGLLTRPTE
jgi:integrase